MTAPAEKISHYRLSSRIGRGGMGVVYRAVDEKLGRQVALKLLSRRFEASPEMQARFIREARAASALSHPGIVTVHDVDAWEGRLFIVMEWIDGVRLSDLAREGISIEEALRLCADAADALAVAHASGILHRDIKSENLMRTRDGRLKVLDFGLAKLRAGTLSEAMHDPLTGQQSGPIHVSLPGDDDDELVHAGDVSLDATRPAEPLGETMAAPVTTPLGPITAELKSGQTPQSARSQRLARSLQSSKSGQTDPLQLQEITSSELTAAGAIMGTPAYMSPEQTVGEPPDVRSEVFSLGVVLYELLVGRRPFAGESAESTMTAVFHAVVQPPSRAVPMRHIPPAVDALVHKALAKNPEQRFADMSEFARALREQLKPPLSTRARTHVRALATATLILAVIAGTAIYRGRRSSLPRAHATSTRRITFDPGCEEYPSFAPDGKTLVFDGVTEDDYELFALDLASGARRRLTHTASWDFGGSVSPDGKRVAFVHLGEGGRELRVVPLAAAGDGARDGSKDGANDGANDGDRSPLVLGPIAGFASWRPDGALLAGNEQSEIVSYDFRVTPPRPSTMAHLLPGQSARFLGAFPDGAVMAIWLPSVEATELVLGEILAGQAPRVLVDHIPYDATGVVPAPAGDAFYTAQSRGGANELLRRARRGGAAEVVPGGVSPAAGFSIAPDGKRLAYSTCRESIHVARLRSGAPPQPLSGAGPWRDRYPVVVDDHRLLFTSDRSGSNEVWLLDLATHESRAITPVDSSFAAVSPDHKTLAWCDHGGVRVRSLDGGEIRTVTNEPGDTLLHFTHDGRDLLFERSDDREGSRAFAAPVDGGAAHAVTPPGARFATPSPTEDRVVFLTPVKGGLQVMLTDLTGSAPRPLANLAPGEYSAPAFTPDGRRLLLVRKDVEVIELPIDGSAPATVRWRAGPEGIESVVSAPDGDGLIAALALWEGDLWLAEGDFQ